MSITERENKKLIPAGAASALAAAVLFGVSTPLGKLLLGNISPVLLAALFYLGAGIGLSLIMGWGSDGRRGAKRRCPERNCPRSRSQCFSEESLLLRCSCMA